MIKHRLQLQITQIMLLFSVLCFLFSVCYAQEIVSSTELIQNGKAYDGKQIVYEGEVIGEVMKRKDGVWVNIYDKQNAIGVWMSEEFASIIEYQGSYKAKGDILRVRGIFNYNCPLHGGDLDIHASSLQKIKSGQLKQEKIIPTKRNLLIILIGILCLISISRILITR